MSDFPTAERISPCYRLTDRRIAIKLTQREAINDPAAERYTDKASGARVWLKPITDLPDKKPSADDAAYRAPSA